MQLISYRNLCSINVNHLPVSKFSWDCPFKRDIVRSLCQPFLIQRMLFKQRGITVALKNNQTNSINFSYHYHYKELFYLFSWSSDSWFSLWRLYSAAALTTIFIIFFKYYKFCNAVLCNGSIAWILLCEAVLWVWIQPLILGRIRDPNPMPLNPMPPKLRKRNDLAIFKPSFKHSSKGVLKQKNRA